MKQYTLLTNSGINKLLKTASDGSKIALKEVVVSDFEGELSEQTASIPNEKYRGAINAITIDESDSNILDVDAVIPPEVGGFYIKTAGIYCDDGSLFAVARLADTYKPLLSEGSSKDITLSFRLQIANANDSIVLKVDNNVVLATRKWSENQFLKKTEKAADSDKLDGLEASSFVKKEDTLTKRLPAGDYNSWDFWRSIPAGTYWHIDPDGSNPPTPWAFVEVVSYNAEKDVIWRIGGDVYMLHINHNKVPIQWDKLVAEREFQCSKAQNSYTKLPNGLILQWGSIAGGVAGERAFPIAFPNIVLAVIAGNADAQGAVVDNAFACAISKEKFYYGTKSSYGGAVSCFPGSYIAIGY